MLICEVCEAARSPRERFPANEIFPCTRPERPAKFALGKGEDHIMKYKVRLSPAMHQVYPARY